MRELLRRGSGPTFPFEVKSPKSARPVFWGLYLCSYLLDIPDVGKKKRAGKIWREQTREDRKSRPSSNKCLFKHQ